VHEMRIGLISIDGKAVAVEMKKANELGVKFQTIDSFVPVVTAEGRVLMIVYALKAQRKRWRKLCFECDAKR